MTINGPNGIAAHKCRIDFWEKLQEAMIQAHGGPSLEVIAKMPLEEVVNQLAQNGIRMTFNEEWHVERFGVKPATKITSEEELRNLGYDRLGRDVIGNAEAVVCERCGGSGRQMFPDLACYTCGGSGKLP